MPKPKDSEETLYLGDSPQRRKEKARRSTGLGTIILFWPFLIYHWLLRGLPGFLRAPLMVAGDCVIAAVYGIAVLGVVYGLRAQPFDMVKVQEMPERSIVLDRHGKEIGRIHGEQRDIIRYDQISPLFLAAILAREDARFWDHHGVDWYGVGRATYQNFRGKRQGASTLTMQLARNSFDLRSKLLAFSPTLQELDRKLLEAAVSYRIESNYSKEQIITHYVNRIFWGHSIRGIEEASRTYLEKHASELDLSDSAMLAGIVRGPNAFSPFKDIHLAERERNGVLKRMVELNSITEQQAAEARKEVINIRPEWRRLSHDSYSMDAVRRDLERILEEKNIEFGGLVITTTIDQLIQTKAEEALDARLRQLERGDSYPHQTRAAWKALQGDEKPAPQYIQGGVVAIENLTGAILAVVGGRDADESKFNRALQAQRQVGSIFKPFVYMAAFDAGEMNSDTSISDGPLQPGEIEGARGWHPHNSDGKFGGYYPASYGLIHSRNTMSIRVGNSAGLNKVKEIAQDAGFSADIPNKPSIYLGAWEATPMEVASAYTIFPNEGQRFRPYIIDEIRDRQGNLLYKTPPLSYDAVKHAGSAWAISRILAEVTTSGTAAAVKSMGFSKPCAGKTGTTNDFRDAWFSGFTSSITCAVWVGLDKPQRTIQGGYGATLALPVWVEVMKTAEKLGYKAEGLKSKLPFAECRLCRLSGKRATPGCEAAGQAYTERMPKDIVPAENDFCPVHPLSAQPVDEEENGSAPPPRAQAIEDTEDEPAQPPPPPKAIPVGE